MVASFTNHFLFVYQIALNEYNDDLIIPILDLITTKNLSAKKIFL